MVSANNAINDTVGASISGVTNTLTVTNASNTASSAARETIVVGGGTAGDPTINWNVSGVTNWEMGIDNSASDSLKISQGTALGTNDTWTMTTAGQRNLPMQSIFSSRLSTNPANVTGDSTTYTIKCDTVLLNVTSSYNNGTGVFTAPVAGNYLFTGSIGINNANASHVNWVANLNINATEYQLGIIAKLSAVCGAAQPVALSFSFITPMAAMDTAFLSTRVQGGTKTISIYGTANATVFSGFLLS